MNSIIKECSQTSRHIGDAHLDLEIGELGLGAPSSSRCWPFCDADKLGRRKASPIFSRKFLELVAIPASRIDYVGDRLDNNIIPVRDVGLAVIFIEARALEPAHVRRPEIAMATPHVAHRRYAPWGHSRTSARSRTMSAAPSRADIRGQALQVRLVSTAEVARGRRLYFGRHSTLKAMMI
jgi:hypothetical protein